MLLKVLSSGIKLLQEYLKRKIGCILAVWAGPVHIIFPYPQSTPSTRGSSGAYCIFIQVTLNTLGNLYLLRPHAHEYIWIHVI